MTRANTEGFTLVELLVTVTLLSLLLVVLFGGLRFGVRAWDGAQAHGVRTDELRVVQDLLRREIEQAYPALDSADPLHPVIDFHGGPDSMTFLAPAPQAEASAGRARITIVAERRGGGLQLVMRAAPELATGGEGAWSAPLLHNIASAQFSFFNGSVWRSDWSDATAMPVLIRIHMTFGPRDGRNWPDLIVAPRIAFNAGCVYDPGTHHCQGRS
jgi:general secretion pathway protein J